MVSRYVGKYLTSSALITGGRDVLASPTGQIFFLCWGQRLFLLGITCPPHPPLTSHTVYTQHFDFATTLVAYKFKKIPSMTENVCWVFPWKKCKFQIKNP